MRILLVSDLHYVLPQIDWVLGRIPDYDLVVLAGDQLDIASPVPLDAQIAVLHAVFERVAEPHKLLVASGNHDLTGPDANGEQCALWLEPLRALGVSVDGDVLAAHDTTVTVCPWWDGPRGHFRVAGQFRRDGQRPPGTWVWVYHWPPSDSPTCWTGKKHYGDADLRSWIIEYQPDLVLTGHVHNPPFRGDGSWVDRIGSTWVFNAGRQIGPVPAHIEIDVDTREATWHSLLGVEVQRLDEPLTLHRPSF